MYLANQPKTGKMPDGQPTVFGENVSKMNDSKQAFNAIRTAHRGKIGYKRLRKPIKSS